MNTKISALSSGSPAQLTDETVIARTGNNFNLQISDIVGFGKFNKKSGSGAFISFDEDDPTGFWITDDTGTAIISGDSNAIGIASNGSLEIDDISGPVFITDGSGNTTLAGTTSATLSSGSGIHTVSLVFTGATQEIAIAGHITAANVGAAQAQDIAGTVTIPASSTSAAQSFGSNFTGTNTPIVVITPTSDPLALGVPVGYWVTVAGTAGAWTGFTINIQSALPSDLIFNYIVIGQQ